MIGIPLTEQVVFRNERGLPRLMRSFSPIQMRAAGVVPSEGFLFGCRIRVNIE